MRTQNLSEIGDVIRTFYETYKILGTVEVSFGARRMPDSDGDSVVDVYLHPMDALAQKTMQEIAPVSPYEDCCHMQFLADMIAPEIMGYKYKLEIQLENKSLKVTVIDKTPSQNLPKRDGIR